MARYNADKSTCREEFKQNQVLNNDKICKSRVKPLTRANRQDIYEVKLNLKAQLPILTAVAVKRKNVAYHESIVFELEENGMKESASYLWHLFHLDPDKLLITRRDLVDYLKLNLTAVEHLKRVKIDLDRVRILLKTAMFFKKLSKQWLWLVHELLKHTLHVVETVKIDREPIVNAVKLIYGKFLVHDMKKLTEARQIVEEVREASEGKEWNVSKLLKIAEIEENLCRASNVLLYEIFSAMAEEKRPIDASAAVELSLQALKHSKYVDYERDIANALHLLGRCQMASGTVEGALDSFTKFLSKAKKLSDHLGVCSALEGLAFAHRALNDVEGTLRHLQMLRRHAEDFNLPLKLAGALYITGKYLLNQNRPNDASKYLTEAFDLFKSLNRKQEVDRCRFLLGVSRGEEMLEEYMQLVLKSSLNDSDALKKLLQWKDRRIPFANITSDEDTSRSQSRLTNSSDEMNFTSFNG